MNIQDAQNRTATASITVTVIAAADSQEHLVMGNPSGATADVNNPLNYLLLKNQYAMSYHRDRAIPNWVSWHLDSSWIGSAPRQDDFRPDETLPAGFYRVMQFDYSGSGFDRGHHTPSADRTRSIPDNSATFLMTNMMPQAPGNNQGPWERLESFSRGLVGQGSELYTLMGGVGNGGTGTAGNTTNTIAAGRIAVPAFTWKVILVLPNGDNDVARVNNNTRTIAVIMPNKDNIRPDEWQKYLATVDQVEALTGYDFFSNVPAAIQNVIESRLDAASNTMPQTVAGGTYTDLEITAPNTTITGSVTVTGNLNLGGSILNAPAGLCVTFGTGGSVTRLSGYVNGCTVKQFPAIAPPPLFGAVRSPAAVTFEYPVGTANGSSPVTATVTAAAAGSSLAVTAVQGVQPNVTGPERALKRYWTLTETGDLTVDLTFKYLDGDVPAGVAESGFTLQRYNGIFTTIPATVDPAANTARTRAITEFSDWTLVGLAPSAAGVSISGQVILPNDFRVHRATVTLTDTRGNAQTVITGKTGRFRLSEVAAGETYVITVRAGRYAYLPQVISVTGDLTGLVFTLQP